MSGRRPVADDENREAAEARQRPGVEERLGAIETRLRRIENLLIDMQREVISGRGWNR